MVNIFFQEWAPLFPILHRPTFLTLYEEYTASPESVTDKTSLALLNLVFGLAAISQGVSHAMGHATNVKLDFHLLTMF